MNDVEKALRESFDEILSKPNVLSAVATQTKVTDGVDTGVPCITVYVTDKPPEFFKSGRRRIAKKNMIQREIDEVPVDVVRLYSPDYELGKTGVGSLPPHLKKRRMGVKK